MTALALLTSLETEYKLVQERAGWARLGVGVIRVTGPDRAKWLHKIITADVEDLGVGQGTRAALLDVKGHFAGDFTVLLEPDSILLLTEPEDAQALLHALSRYIIREKAQLTDESGGWALFTVIGVLADDLTAELFNPQTPGPLYSFARLAPGSDDLAIRARRALLPATDILVSSADSEHVRDALNSTPELSQELILVLRVEAGIPRWGVDFDATTLVLEIPDIHSVRVDQGCYVGQEVVARLVHRGHVNRKLVGLKFRNPQSPARGDLILDKGKEVGLVTSATYSPRFGTIGLGYVRRELSESGTLLMVGDNPSAEVVKIPFEE